MTWLRRRQGHRPRHMKITMDDDLARLLRGWAHVHQESLASIVEKGIRLELRTRRDAHDEDRYEVQRWVNRDLQRAEGEAFDAR